MPLLSPPRKILQTWTTKSWNNMLNRTVSSTPLPPTIKAFSKDKLNSSMKTNNSQQKKNNKKALSTREFKNLLQSMKDKSNPLKRKSRLMSNASKISAMEETWSLGSSRTIDSELSCKKEDAHFKLLKISANLKKSATKLKRGKKRSMKLKKKVNDWTKNLEKCMSWLTPWRICCKTWWKRKKTSWNKTQFWSKN